MKLRWIVPVLLWAAVAAAEEPKPPAVAQPGFMLSNCEPFAGVPEGPEWCFPATMAWACDAPDGGWGVYTILKRPEATPEGGLVCHVEMLLEAHTPGPDGAAVPAPDGLMEKPEEAPL